VCALGRPGSFLSERVLDHLLDCCFEPRLSVGPSQPASIDCLTDSEGRELDFKNMLVILTSNLASGQLLSMDDRDDRPSSEDVVNAIRPVLSRHFKPALLARMTVVPFVPLGEDAMREVVEMKLTALSHLLADTHRITARLAPDLASALAARCIQPEMGARNVDHVLRGGLMLALSLLEKFSVSEQVTRVEIGERLCFRDRAPAQEVAGP